MDYTGAYHKRIREHRRMLAEQTAWLLAAWVKDPPSVNAILGLVKTADDLPSIAAVDEYVRSVESGS